LRFPHAFQQSSNKTINQNGRCRRRSKKLEENQLGGLQRPGLQRGEKEGGKAIYERPRTLTREPDSLALEISADLQSAESSSPDEFHSFIIYLIDRYYFFLIRFHAGNVIDQ